MKLPNMATNGNEMSDDRDLYDLIRAMRKAQRKYNDHIGDGGHVSVDLTVTVWDSNWDDKLKVITDSDYGFPTHENE